MMTQNKQHRAPHGNKITKKVNSVLKKIPGKPKDFLKERSVRSRTSSATPKSPKRRSLDGETGHNIEVILRCKGKNNIKSTLLSSVRSSALMPVNGCEEKEILLNSNNTVYKYDHIFYQDCSQQKLYDQVAKPILHEVLNGYNCTIFAYGQTGTGKTYTMEGDLENTDGKCAPNAGIIPRIICDLFQDLKKKEGENTVKISMLELYNEELRDLIYPGDEIKALNIFEDSKAGVKIQNVYEEMITSATQGLHIMKAGVKKRMTAATNCNKESSRSHCIFTITVSLQEKNLNGDIVCCTSKINLVDLAGSENSKASGSEHIRAKEAASINKSLLTLGRVINSLAEKAPHIPYRESKLTRLLKDSLGGRTKTAIITTIDPLTQNAEDIKNTLEYGSHAKSISNVPQKNDLDPQNRHAGVWASEIVKMQKELRRAWEKNGYYMPREEYDELIDKIDASEKLLVEKNAEITEKNAEMAKHNTEMAMVQKENARLRKVIETKDIELQSVRTQVSEMINDMDKISEITGKSSLKRGREDDEEQPRKKR